MDLYDAMSTTRAVRRLRSEPVPDELLRRIIEAANWAPTGGNAQPWRVIAVRDAEKRKGLQELYLGPWACLCQGTSQADPFTTWRASARSGANA